NFLNAETGVSQSPTSSANTGMTLPCFASARNSSSDGVTCAVISWIAFDSRYVHWRFDWPLPFQGRGEGDGLQLQFPRCFGTPHLNPLPLQQEERRPDTQGFSWSVQT